MKTGSMKLPLHGGKAPYWLFSRMKKLAREIVCLMVSEYGSGEVLKRLSDPLWFQALGCVLGFDWHSSGVTTTVCGALKEGIKGLEKDLGLFIAGGKGATSRKTPTEIETAGNLLGLDLSCLVYNSKIVAKVDSSALQDGYQLYHHCFFFTSDGRQWSVVQQGLNQTNRMARRYHWLSDKVTDFTTEPHSAICCDQRAPTLNLVDPTSQKTKEVIAQLSLQKPAEILKDLKLLQNYQEKKYSLPARHQIKITDMDYHRLSKIFTYTYEHKPPDFEALLSVQGVGPKTVRALALISELIYGARYSIQDPARFSFAHGGKDGIPYPVDRENYNRSIDLLHRAVKESKIGISQKTEAIKRLATFYG
ncbi:MAG: DUF763 domain-containing protein [Actinomycetota bacterium]|nr:DUF763 domain-containing protein [Actinomycetota bacterium]